MYPVNAGGVTDFNAVACDCFAAIEEWFAPFNHHECFVKVLNSQRTCSEKEKKLVPRGYNYVMDWMGGGPWGR